MPGSIVLGYDGSEGAHAALAEVASLASRLGARVVVGFGYGVEQLGGEVRDHAEAVHAFGERHGNEAVAALRAAGVEAEVSCVAERPAEALVHIAEAIGAEMIVVGTYSESPLKSAILGSTPHRLLHRARIPVLVVPVPEEG